MLHDEADEDLMVQYQQGEVRAFASEGERRRLSDALGRAGDQNDFAGKSRFHFFLQCCGLLDRSAGRPIAGRTPQGFRTAHP